MEQTVNAPADISADYSFIMDDDSMSGDGIRAVTLFTLPPATMWTTARSLPCRHPTAWRFATSGSIAGTLPL